MSELHARPMREDDLQAVLDWRNHPSVRRCMLTQHEIGIAEHRAWFERASQDPQRRLLIVEESAEPLGFVHFNGVRAGAAADWGFYAVPGAPKGAGRKLGCAALNLAFDSYLLHKVCGQALHHNEASIGFHLALGFRAEGILREQHLIEGSYYDLHCFGLLQQEWRGSPTI